MIFFLWGVIGCSDYNLQQKALPEAEAEVAEALGMMGGRITEAADERGATGLEPDSMMMMAEPTLVRCGCLLALPLA